MTLSTDWSAALDDLRESLAAAGDAEDARAMAAYMKDRFPFFGVKAGPRRRLQRPLARLARAAGAAGALGLAEACWTFPERELQLVGADVLRAAAPKLQPQHLPRVSALITHKAWWDTVDILAAHVVGTMARRHRELLPTLDSWVDAGATASIEDGALWLARTAVIHQITWKNDTDSERLFSYCDRLAAHREFFIRKALGWALRSYAATDPEAVRAYLARAGDRLSGLTRREAAKHLS